MNKRLISAIIWVVASVLAVLNMNNEGHELIWSAITMLFAWNAIRQFKLYREEKENEDG